MSYTHLFFDLDHTLWDFEQNSRITLVELFEEKQLDRLGVPDFDAFYTAYKEENDLLWARYRKGEIKKDELRSSRFHNTLKRFGDGDDRCASEIEQAYIERSPYQTQLLPGAMETVRVLSTRLLSAHHYQWVSQRYRTSRWNDRVWRHTSIVYSVLKLWAFKNQMHGFFYMP